MKTLLAFFLLSLPSFGAVSVTSSLPAFGWSVLAGSVRNIGFVIGGGTGNLLNYSISATTGGATATTSCTSNCIPVVTITLGATAGSCTINGSIGGYSVTSTASVTLLATSVDDGSKTFAVPINVCANTTQIYVVPFYRTLYANQKANLQSFIIGNTNLAVTWSITVQPGGGDGTLDDTGNRDTVFKASVAGRYTIHCVSTADGTVSQDVIMYVTGNAQPYAVTPNLTEPVDPTVDPSLTGTTYDVCASGTCSGAHVSSTLAAVPVNVAGSFPSGSTIRLHNEDVTGSNPTVYFEYFEIGQSLTGSATQPLRIVGVPDSLGNLPILDGNGATGRSTISTSACSGFAIVCVWPGGSFGYYQNGPNKANYILVEGLHARNARPGFAYTTPSGGAANWGASSTALRISGGFNVEMVGNESDNTGNGTFSDSNTNNNAWRGGSLAVLWEGNYIHNFGVSAVQGVHGLYIQDIVHLVQFNRIDNPIAGMTGSCFKSRTVAEVIRYNFIGSYNASGGGCARIMDMVEIQDNSAYTVFGQGSGGSSQGYLGYTGNTNCNTSFWCLGDTMGPNILIGWQEATANTFVYGNVEENNSSSSTLGASINAHHFCGDQGTDTLAERNGTLNFYNNTFWVNNTLGGFGQWQNLIDTSCVNGNPFNLQNALLQNNIYWGTSSGSFPLYTYMANNGTILATMTTNVLANANPITYTAPINGGSLTGHTGSGWGNALGTFAYTLAIPIDTHLGGLSSGNFIYSASQPFNSTSFLPVSPSNGTALAGGMATMPVRFMYQPNLSYAIARNTVVNSSTGGQVGALDSPASPTVPTITSTCPGPPGIQNAVYPGYQSTATGSTPFTWGKGTGSFPTGLTQDTATGLISGTPTGTGTSNFQITVSNGTGSGTNSPQACSIVISAPSVPVNTTSCPLPPGTQGSFYTTTLTATGAAPITWSTGTLPNGLTLVSATGVISGTPTSNGTTNFTITPTNGGGSASPTSCSIVIAAASNSQPGNANR